MLGLVVVRVAGMPTETAALSGFLCDLCDLCGFA
jgi:hypothetical protein